MKRKMTSRERFLTAIAHCEPDRAPINYMYNPGIDKRLKAHFGLDPTDDEGLRQALGVDFRQVSAPYIGPLQPHIDEKSGVMIDEWGRRRRLVKHASGAYWEWCDFPLAAATEEEVAAWPMPDPDHYDYSQVKEACDRWRDYAVFVGGTSLGDVINHNGYLRGVEQSLIDIATGDPAGLLLAQRRIDIQVETIRRTLEAAGGNVAFLWMGEDLGTQRAPLISPTAYRTHIKPLHQKVIDLAKAYDLPVMIHSCGSSSWAFADFIEMGINVVDTLQPEAANMAPEYLKATYGGRLAFHGCISTAGPVINGTVEDVVAYCKRTLDIMMPGGGYCFAPTHRLQDNSITENVVAMYETAQRHGVYS